jgi:hypothetical protein
METSQEVGDLFAALSKAQGTMKGAVKDSENTFFKSKYADLASVWDACRDALASNGLSVIQAPSSEGPKVSVTTILAHSSGQWVRDTLTMESKDASPHAIGLTISYARRYSLSAIAGIAQEDDDGEAAQGRNQMAPLGQGKAFPVKADIKAKGGNEPPPPSDHDAPPALAPLGVNRAGKKVDNKPLVEPLRDDEIAF